MTQKRILLVEDCASLALVYQRFLAQENYDISIATTGSDAFSMLNETCPDAVVLDLKLPDMDGMKILKHIHQSQLPTTVVVITAYGSIDIAVDAMHYGAFDFLVKPFDAKRLNITLQNALKNQQLSKQVENFRDDFSRTQYEGFIGESLAMQSIYRIIDSAASSNATLFITGESGTGKEVCASAIHQRSERSSSPFITLNCAAIPNELLESEIFGHLKGAFTGAHSDRDGAATLANNGTLFFDEICEMPLLLQSKLLRFIQTQTFSRVGSSKLEQVNIRFVCATNKDPWQQVIEGQFREDLYYRLHVIPITLPPLRERDTDIKLLINSFLIMFSNEEGKSFTSFSHSATQALMSYAWPGNIRELQNVIRNIVVLHDSDQVTLAMLPRPVNTITPENTRYISAQEQALDSYEEDSERVIPLWQVEKSAIEHAINLCNGNIPRAAALLDVSASTIYRKKERWETKA